MRAARKYVAKECCKDFVIKFSQILILRSGAHWNEPRPRWSLLASRGWALETRDFEFDSCELPAMKARPGYSQTVDEMRGKPHVGTFPCGDTHVASTFVSYRIRDRRHNFGAGRCALVACRSKKFNLGTTRGA